MYVGKSVEKQQAKVKWNDPDVGRLALESGFKVNALAKKLGITARHLRRILKKRRGMTPHQLLLELRLKMAARLLAQGSEVKRVAVSLGFKQASHFARVFKRFHGVSPSKQKQNDSRTRSKRLSRDPEYRATSVLQMPP